jgi:hypothetical protein
VIVFEVEDLGLAYPLKQQRLKKSIRQTLVLIFLVSGVLQVAGIDCMMFKG